MAVATIPATPIAGTADPNPLITRRDYQMLTRQDAASDDFTYALSDALDMVQRHCKRTLLYGQYTERCFVYKNGIVYPSAVPLDDSKQVSSSASTPGNAIFQGSGIWVGWFVPLPALPVWEGVVPPQSDVTYWGGYVGVPTNNPQQPPLPARLKRAICKIVWFMLNPAILQDLPGGVKSVSVGGVSMAGDLSSMMVADYQLKSDLDRFVLRRGKTWQN